MPDYRDGVKYHIATDAGGYLPATYNAAHDQIAKCLDCTKWVPVPLGIGYHSGQNANGESWPLDVASGADWNLGHFDIGGGDYVRHWMTTGGNQELVFDLTGHPALRDDCILTGVRVKTGGNVNGGSAAVYQSQPFTEDTVAPGQDSKCTGGDIFLAADNKFNGTGHLTANTSISVTIAEGYVYKVIFTSGSGTCRVFGLDIMSQYPLPT